MRIYLRGFCLALLLVLALSLLVTTAQAGQLYLYELFEAHPQVQVLRDGPIVRVQSPPVETLEAEASPTSPSRKVALTFDDGPEPRHTSQILDILKAEDVVATFFLVGRNAQNYPDLVRRMYGEGHLLANHSLSHADFTGLTNEEIMSLELLPTSKVIENITGVYPLIMRPPYGALRADSVDFLRQLGWQIVRWSLDTFDWDNTRNRPDQILNRIKELHHPNAIVLMHCNGPATINVLRDVIQTLRDLGYVFVTVTDL